MEQIGEDDLREIVEAVPRRARRLAPEARQDAILEAAVDLCVEAGLESVSARRVAKALEVTTGLVLHYFGTSDRLVAAAFREVANSRLAALREAAGRAVGPRAAIQSILSFLFDHPPSAADFFWFDAARIAQSNNDLRSAVADQHEWWREELAAVIHEGRSVGVFTCPDADWTSQKCWVLVDGLIIDRIWRKLPTCELLARATRYFEEELGCEGLEHF